MLALRPPLRQWFGAFAGGMQWNRNVCAERVGSRAILVPQVGALGILVAPPALKNELYFKCLRRRKRTGPGPPEPDPYKRWFGTAQPSDIPETIAWWH